MAHNYIIQWNCRGLRRNSEDIELLISRYSPAAVCLQETMLKRDQIQTFKNYSAYYKNGINGHGGFIQNQHLVAVFFDLQKAYDTTWKHGIQQDLHDLGLRGNLPIFIGNFLTNRTFQIHLRTILSEVFYQEEGVLQGAILSTTLFNVKINNIVKQIDPGVECSLYVDDFVIMYKSPTMDAIQRKLQHTINRLEKWTLENGFTISKNKTVAMHFCMHFFPIKNAWILFWN